MAEEHNDDSITPAELDVLCGKDKEARNHKGSKLYRDFIRKNAKMYETASDEAKYSVAKRIVDAFKQVAGSRFLEQNEDGSWKELTDDEAVKKTQQHCRDRLKLDRAKKAKPTKGSASNTDDDTNQSAETAPSVPPGGQPVLILNENDVLCGRGKEQSNHSGNKLFQQLISNDWEQFDKATTKQEKKEVAEIFIRAFRQQYGGRILEKREDGGWYEIGDERAVGKVQQSFRDMKKKMKKPEKVDYEKQTAQTAPSVLPGEQPVLILNENDVLCGKGKEQSNHSGNKLFQQLISNDWENFDMAPTKQGKKKVAEIFVGTFRQHHGGRILEKREDGGWYEIGDEKAVAKVQQSFRDMKKKMPEKVDNEEKMESPPVPDNKEKMETDITSVTKSTASMSISQGSQVTPISLDSKGNPVFPSGILIEKLDEKDVIMYGTNDETQKQKGNKLYMEFLKNNAGTYEAAADAAAKQKVAKRIVASFQDVAGGRFVEKKNSTGKWYEVENEKAVEATEAAFKEILSRKQADQEESASISVGSILSGLSQATASSTGKMAADALNGTGGK